jgi:glutamine amidotransferase
VVILSVDPAYKAHAYVINEASGVWDGDIWYSNDDYQDVPETDDLTSGDYCPRCGAVDVVDPVTWYCRACGTCADCTEPNGFCVCYSPGRWAHSQQLAFGLEQLN